MTHSGSFADWEEKTFKDLTKINQGLQIAIADRLTSPVDGAYFYITNEFLRPNSKQHYYIKNPPKSVICSDEDILMTRTGNTGQVVTGVSGAFHNNFFIIRFNQNELSRWFLYYFLRLLKTQQTILRLAGTSTIPDLNHSDFYRIKINLPTIQEQQKIANFLIAIDDKITAVDQQIDQMETFKKGLLQQMFV